MKKKIKKKVFNNLEIKGTYKEIIEHVKSLKIILFTVNARGGSGFFHSLIDSNPEIINMPEIRTQWDYLNNIKNMPVEIVADRFASRNPEIFNSSLKIIEGWDTLGIDSNTYVTVDINIFKYHFSELVKHIKINEKNIFLILHISYWITCNNDPLLSKVLFYHLHMARDPAEPFIPYGIDYEILHITRDPRIGFVRYQESVNNNKVIWDINPNKQVGDILYHSPSRLLANFKSVIEQVQIFRRNKDKLMIFTLEDLHEKRLNLINKIFRLYGIKELDSEPISTFWGLNWHADIKSEKSISGFQEGKRSFNFKRFLNYYDVFLIEFLTYERSNQQGHKTILKLPKTLYYIFSPIFFIFVILPISYEMKNLKYEIKNKRFLKILLNIFYYFKRIIFCWNWLLLIMKNKILLPKQID